MKNKLAKMHWEALINIAMLISICLSLIAALSIQLVWDELPCPLCLIQRAFFCAIAFGLLLNMRYGFKPQHYSVILISSLLAMAVSLRQIVLHIIPGTGAYGSPLLGFHLYTWVFIGSFTVLLATSALLGSERQYSDNFYKHHWTAITHILYSVLLSLLIANALTTIQICGFSACPGDPKAVLK